MRSLALISVLLASTGAWAHDADIVFAQAERTADGLVRERITLTAATLQLLAPVEPDGNGLLTDAGLAAASDAIGLGVWDQMPLSSASGPCTRKSAQAKVRTTYVQLDGTFECGPGELRQQFRILQVLPSAYKVVLGVYGQGELQGQSFAQGNQQTLTLLGEAKEGGASRGLLGWVSLGVQHIFLGIDHIAFLIAVLLVGGNPKRILLLVTSFTVAHSITLGAAALDLIPLTESALVWVEVAIAASIVWVAVENLVLKQHRHRAYLTFAFGLVHGFGFASVLGAYGLGDAVAVGLFGFNLGVELGQAAIVLALYPLMRLIARRATVERWTVRVASGAIMLAGAAWMVDRLPG